MSGVDLTDQFFTVLQFFCMKVSKWSKKFFVHCLDMVILNGTYSPQEIFRQQNNALAVQDTTSKAHVE